MVGQIKRRDDIEMARTQGCGPFKKTDGIVKNIMFPENPGGRGINRQRGSVQAQIMAVVWPDQHAVTGQPDRVSVRICGGVYDADAWHVFPGGASAGASALDVPLATDLTTRKFCSARLRGKTFLSCSGTPRITCPMASKAEQGEMFHHRDGYRSGHRQMAAGANLSRGIS
jgi:hypothetical protein